MNEDSLAGKATRAIADLDVISILKDFDPHWVGSIPIYIGIQGSDIDIACEVKSFMEFRNTLQMNFSRLENFNITDKEIRGEPTLICRFVYQNLPFEIFGQQVPVVKQYAFRHMIIEQKILNRESEDFRKKIIDLKKMGHSTEEAFAILLGIKGDPYLGLLDIE